MLNRVTPAHTMRPRGNRVLVLITQGPRTGLVRRALLRYFPDAENLIVVAANTGRPIATYTTHTRVPTEPADASPSCV